MKGMLTGPVTVLNWSFPRKDLTRQVRAAMRLALYTVLIESQRLIWLFVPRVHQCGMDSF